MQALLVSILLAIALGGRPAAAEPASGTAPPPAGAERLLDDFTGPPHLPEGYGGLETHLPQRLRGAVRWRSVPEGRPGGDGRSLRVEYALPGDAEAEFAFRIDLGDVDATPYDHLVFWLKGDERAGHASSLKVGLRRPKTGAPGFVEDGTEVVPEIGPSWRRVVIPLGVLSGIRDWTHLAQFFVALEARRADVERGAYYLDDVELVATGERGPTVSDDVVPVAKRAWERSLGGTGAVKRAARERLAGWPGRFLVDRASLPAGDGELLTRIARDSWRGLDALVDRESRLPVDHVILDASLDPVVSEIGDYTNVTSVGLWLVAAVAARELGFLTSEEAAARITDLLDTLERLETRDGFFFNYYDTTSLERTSNYLSFVDSAWLTAGLMVVRQTFPALAALATRLIDAGNYRFFYDDVKLQMSQGYYVNVPTRSEYHYGVLYTEARLGSLIAIGKGDVPAAHWYRMVRTFPAEATWQTQRPRGRRSKTAHGQRFEGGWYEWKGLRYVPSWGGSAFEALMPVLVLDEKRFAPRSLGKNGVAHAAIQRRYAEEELRYPVFGFSPAAVPGDSRYGEYGVRVLGAAGYGSEAVAPYATALTLAVTPGAAVAGLRKLTELYDVYGDYGFYDAVDPRSGAVAHQYLTLDQAMILISAANYLKDGCIQRRFAADPIAARALPVIAGEDFFR